MDTRKIEGYYGLILSRQRGAPLQERQAYLNMLNPTPQEIIKIALDEKRQFAIHARCVCEICNVAFQTKRQLVNHRRSHRQRKPKAYSYHCERCNRNFYRKSHYDSHMRAHEQRTHEQRTHEQPVYNEPQYPSKLERFFRGLHTVDIEKVASDLDNAISQEKISEVMGGTYFIMKEWEYEIFCRERTTASEISLVRLMCDAILYVGSTQEDYTYHRPSKLLKFISNQSGLQRMIILEQQKFRKTFVIHTLPKTPLTVARIYEALLIHVLDGKIANDVLPHLPINIKNCMASGIDIYDLGICLLHWACKHIGKSLPIYYNISDVMIKGVNFGGVNFVTGN